MPEYKVLTPTGAATVTAPDGADANTIFSFVQKTFGLDPNAERLSILPHPYGALKSEGRGSVMGNGIDWGNWIAPQIVADAARAISAPKAAAEGIDVGVKDAMNVGLNSMIGASPFSPKSMGNVLGAGIVYKGYPKKELRDLIVRNPDAEWRKSELLNAGFSVKENPNMSVNELSSGKFLLNHLPLWGSKQKEFHVIADSVPEAVQLATQRLSASDRAISSKQKRDFENSLMGKLQNEFGDNFSVSKSERSKSQYITHNPSGTKIRISDHELPLGYVQPDLNLNMSMPVDQQFSEILKLLK